MVMDQKRGIIWRMVLVKKNMDRAFLNPKEARKIMTTRIAVRYARLWRQRVKKGGGEASAQKTLILNPTTNAGI
jgi:hypothetical protein